MICEREWRVFGYKRVALPMNRLVLFHRLRGALSTFTAALPRRYNHFSKISRVSCVIKVELFCKQLFDETESLSRLSEIIRNSRYFVAYSNL